jgi:hypothetical protein
LGGGVGLVCLYTWTRLRSILLHYFPDILSCTSYLCRIRYSSFSAYPSLYIIRANVTPSRLLWRFLQATTL